MRVVEDKVNTMRNDNKEKYKYRVMRHPEYRKYCALRKEDSLWRKEKETIFYKIFLAAGQILLCSSILLGLYLIISELFFGGSILNVNILGSLVLGLPILVLLMGLIDQIAGNIRKHKNKLKRKKISTEDFINYSDCVKKSDHKIIKSVRETLGHIYCIDPEYLYPDDTPEVLRNFGSIVEPYGFELVLGVIQRLNLNIPENQTYPIIKKIHDNAQNVEDIICILKEELEKLQRS